MLFFLSEAGGGLSDDVDDNGLYECVVWGDDGGDWGVEEGLAAPFRWIR